MRELYEETGFSADDVQLEEGFEFRETYYPKSKRFGGKKVEKTLVVFLGKLVVDKHVSLTEQSVAKKDRKVTHSEGRRPQSGLH